jgi:hypothetical protein
MYLKFDALFLQLIFQMNNRSHHSLVERNATVQIEINKPGAAITQFIGYAGKIFHALLGTGGPEGFYTNGTIAAHPEFKRNNFPQSTEVID